MPVLSLGLRVLVVDDNHDAADIIAELLKLLGADVRVCYDAQSALELVRSFPLYAGLLDIHMPGMDGCELARHLRKAVSPRRILLVALTGVSNDAARWRTLEAGFDLHLTKTTSPDVIIATLVAFEKWLEDHDWA